MPPIATTFDGLGHQVVASAAGAVRDNDGVLSSTPTIIDTLSIRRLSVLAAWMEMNGRSSALANVSSAHHIGPASNRSRNGTLVGRHVADARVQPNGVLRTSIGSSALPHRYLLAGDCGSAYIDWDLYDQLRVGGPGGS